MQRFVKFLPVLLVCFGAHGQSKFDPRLLALFDQQSLETLSQENPDFLARQTYLLDNAWYIATNTSGKDLDALEIKIDVQAFNYLAALRSGLIYRRWSEPTYFKIAGSANQILICRSGQELARLWNRHRGATQTLSEPKFEQN